MESSNSQDIYGLDTRTYPTIEQENRINHRLELCKEFYNEAYYERLFYYENMGKGLAHAKQLNELLMLKKEMPEQFRMQHGSGARFCGKAKSTARL
ncbi:MAG: hypothetical protein M1291_04595 [Thaumarchaeota archaeon]|nr:hypothetical protein [Nitrososphaerota archaeon]MDG6927374.1 hypothetical protein [Nitrososphaerota archaeon]MDG6932198.1 hypothetical protein [Nitrososphaerota archaeon]